MQRLKLIKDQRLEHKQRRQKILEFTQMLEYTDGALTNFDEELWNATVETVLVQLDENMIFRWRMVRKAWYAFDRYDAQTN